jgi:hypothetical protein
MTREIAIDKCICMRSDTVIYENNIGFIFSKLIALKTPKNKEVKLSL